MHVFLDDKTSNDQKTRLTLDELNELHRKERKELQSKIQSLKKTVTKGDKKRKKEVDAEIEKLETQFEEKCQIELKNCTQNSSSSNSKAYESLQSRELPKVECAKDENEGANKASKAKKRREKKEKEEAEREMEIAKQEIENRKGPAAIELKKIKEKLGKQGLQLKEVKSDGNCMYYAVSDQLQRIYQISKTCEQLRTSCCEHMLKNVDEFQPYLTLDSDCDMDEEKYREYCEKIKDPTVWGGQLELKALTDVLAVLIEVVQAEGSELIIGNSSSSENKRLVITYHRHMLGSGEHYNSTEPASENNEDENIE